MLMSVHPVAAQVGTTSEHEITARYNLYGAYQVLVAGTGVTGEVVPHEEPVDPAKPDQKPTKDKIKIRFTVAADAVPGPRTFRVATPNGASTVAQMVVVRDAVIAESGENDQLAQAQQVTLPAALSGTIEKGEDVDYYKFQVGEGQSWTFHVQAARLEDRIHDLQNHVDPILVLRDKNGVVLAQSDNYFYADPLMNYKFAAAGEYFVEIRDVRFQGNPAWVYSLEVSNRPFVTQVFPSRITPGTPTQVNLVGYNLPAQPSCLVTLPMETPDGFLWTNLNLTEPTPNTVPVISSHLAEVAERPAPHGTPAEAQEISIPAGVSGCLLASGESDWYSFTAKQGERIDFEIVARRHYSELDSVLQVCNDQGQLLNEGDDLTWGRHNHADSWIEGWTAPADGKFLLKVADLHQRGGPGFVYFLKVTKTEPWIMLDMDTDKTLLAPGSSGVIFVRAYRKGGAQGEIQLGIEGLPPGITASCGKILANRSDGCIILTAAADAQQTAGNVRVFGNLVPAEPNSMQPLSATAQPLQEIYMPGGGRFHYPVEMHTVSVGQPMEILSVLATPAEFSIQPGKTCRIDLTIKRREGFKGNVTLDCIFQHLGSIYGNTLPEGITIDDKQSQTVLNDGQEQGYITLVAAADAKPVEKQQVSFMANVSINFVMKMCYSSPPVLITVEKPQP